MKRYPMQFADGGWLYVKEHEVAPQTYTVAPTGRCGSHYRRRKHRTQEAAIRCFARTAKKL